ncbi:MAG: exodeoxyribonuclease VII small subunit [Clostridia bacterium]|nr:exodeoxyribonuclease VII small subunit [Clostridia bacterium]
MKKKVSFEEGMQALEALVQALESGQMTLEESFQNYEQAMKLKAELEALLDESDRRIRVLTENGEREIAGEDAP